MITKPLLFIFLITIISTNQIHYHYYNMDPKNSKIHKGIFQGCGDWGDSACQQYDKFCWKAPWYLQNHCVDRKENGEKCDRHYMCKSVICYREKCVQKI